MHVRSTTPDLSFSLPQAGGRPVPATPQGTVFRLERWDFGDGERSAGSMPVWGPPKSEAEKIAVAARGTADSAAPYGNAFTDATQTQSAAAPDDTFGFGDLVDMVNPLQHIPLVNLAYRHVTGDQIKPIGKLIGGTLFSGPVGAASALVDMGVKAGTGKDMTDYVFGAADLGKAPEAAPPATAQGFTPLRSAAEADLPGTTIALANLSATGSLTPPGFRTFSFND